MRHRQVRADCTAPNMVSRNGAAAVTAGAIVRPVIAVSGSTTKTTSA